MRARLMRGLKWTAILVVGLVVVVGVALPVQQYLFYRRAKRLLADMQTIELHKSTWADAQGLMHRWGRYGNYSGTCTAESCRYSITVGDPIDVGIGWLWDHLSQRAQDHLPLGTMMRFFARVGCRSWTLVGRFIVQDGFIVRSGVHAIGSPTGANGEFYGYLLEASVDSVDHVGSWDDLVDHRRIPFSSRPYYSVGRPGACENCYAAWVAYSHRAPHEIATQLMTINVECFRFRSHCETIEDLLPPVANFDLYNRMSGPVIEKALGVCDLPVWVRARDAHQVIAARGITAGTVLNDGRSSEEDSVKVQETLKGSPLVRGAKMDVMPWNPSEDMMTGVAEHIAVGESVLLFDFYHPPEPLSDYDPKDLNPLALQRCGVIPDTPEARADIARGMAMNDRLRGPGLGNSIWSF